MKRTTSVLLMTLVLSGAVLLTTGAAIAQETTRLSIGGASSGTWIYLYTALLAETWKKTVPGVDVTVLATAGTTANYIPMDKGELDLAGASTSGDFYAMNGLYFTKGKKLSNFTVIMPATKGFNQAFTYADSPINSLKDLDGKRVAVGARGSPTSVIQEEIFKLLGIKPKLVFSTPAEAIEMMKDRRLDAMVYGVGAPWAGVMDVATAQKIKFLSMTPEEQQKIHTAYPYQVPDTIPAKTYAFQTDDVRTTMGFQTINARPGLSDELVYKLVKAIWTQWPEIVKMSPPTRWVKPADILEMVAQIHPGAAKYYREVGIQVPDHKIFKKK